MSLAKYLEKRNFKKTAEPKGGPSSFKGTHRYVIQKHAASRLHYDFRLEMDGVLKSWAVPKGMPYEKGEKRLAMHVEDHPVSYIDFEGNIPKGEYGGGTVMVWDRGTYEALSPHPLKDLRQGKLHFVLQGKKLKGEWHLVRMRDEKAWLMIRGDGNMKPVSKRQDDLSAVSGKTMAQISRSSRIWHSHSSKTNKASTRQKTSSFPKKAKSSHPLPHFVEPMKAQLVKQVPPGNWVYEVKFDGFRALALRAGDNVQLLSRNEKSFDEKFPDIRASVEELDMEEGILDGEIVALDDKGRSSFQLLQAYEMGEKKPPLYFYVFDLLRLDGVSLIKKPLAERKERLKQLLENAPASIRYSASLHGDATELLEKMRKMNLEGLIGKREDSTYQIGRRSGDWIKLKLHQEQEFVIGGFTKPGGSRKYMGAILVGVHEKGKLLFCGKVGTGFTEKSLRYLKETFSPLAKEECPFANLPEKKRPRYGAGMTSAEMKNCHWLNPSLICQIKFSEWTRDGKLRQPVFLGLRKDKKARDVVRERPA